MMDNNSRRDILLRKLAAIREMLSSARDEAGIALNAPYGETDQQHLSDACYSLDFLIDWIKSAPRKNGEI